MQQQLNPLFQNSWGKLHEPKGELHQIYYINDPSPLIPIK